MFNNKFKRLPLKPKLTPGRHFDRICFSAFFLPRRNSCGLIFARGSRVVDLNVDSGAMCEDLIAVVNDECEVKIGDKNEIGNVVDNFRFE